MIQFDIVFPDKYILEDDAKTRLALMSESRKIAAESNIQSVPDETGVSEKIRLQDESSPELDDSVGDYEEMTIGEKRYLCEIPKIFPLNETEPETPDTTEREKELVRATDRGLDLLDGMKDHCMYFVAGWWSYSFCYMNQIRQFHALPPGNGNPFYPPVEDRNALSFVLGRFSSSLSIRGSSNPPKEKERPRETAELQIRGDSRYLVQHLRHGTKCDLTGRERKIEVQFHCHPQSTDRIGWIKETTTCSYLMIVYTPRLCNDVAFQPPREDDAHEIKCQRVLSLDQVPEWEAEHQSQAYVDDDQDYATIGGIRVGSMELVGKDGKWIEQRKATMEDQVEVIYSSDQGDVRTLTAEELSQFKLDPEKYDRLKRELKRRAKGKDWVLQRVTSPSGEVVLQGLIEPDGQPPLERNRNTKEEKKDAEENQHRKEGGEDEHQQKEKQDSSDKETYKDEL